MNYRVYRNVFTMFAHLESLPTCSGRRSVCQACVGATSALDCNLNGYEDDCSGMNDVSCRSCVHLTLIIILVTFVLKGVNYQGYLSL